MIDNSNLFLKDHECSTRDSMIKKKKDDLGLCLQGSLVSYAGSNDSHMEVAHVAHSDTSLMREGTSLALLMLSLCL